MQFDSQDPAGDEHDEPIEGAASEAVAPSGVPSVDDLANRLSDIERAMNNLASGELDIAEAVIDSLDRPNSPASD